MKKVISMTMVLVMVVSMLTVNVLAAEKSPNELANEAGELYKTGNYESSITLYDQALSQDPLFMDAYSGKALSYFQLKNPQKAVDTLSLQLERNPRNKQALYNIACGYAQLNNTIKALEYLKKAIDVNIAAKTNALSDKDFDILKELDEFKKLTAISVRLEGTLLEFDVSPVVIDGRTLLPMRAIFEALDATVSWDEATNTVTAKKGSTDIVLTIDSKSAKINGVETELDVPPMLLSDRTMVPVRFVSEALGAQVSWDGDNEVVNIISAMPTGAPADENVLKELGALVDVLPIDGGFSEPFSLNITEANCFIVAKDKKAFEVYNGLNAETKAKFLFDKTMSLYGDIIGCDPVHLYFVWDNKAYYTADMKYNMDYKEIKLSYYARGLNVNVVKQYKAQNNYKDYYLLAAEEGNPVASPTVTPTVTPTETPSATSPSPTPTTTSNPIADLDPSKPTLSTGMTCTVGPSINFNYVDEFYRTFGSDYIPTTLLVRKVYRYQPFVIVPVYSKFAVNSGNEANIVYTITVKTPNGKEKQLAKDIPAIKGKVSNTDSFYQASGVAEMMLTDENPTGTYTFILDSQDKVSGSTCQNTFTLEVGDYTYSKKPFYSEDEFLDFFLNYHMAPNPDRLTDALFYAVENTILGAPGTFAFFFEALSKNPQVIDSCMNEMVKKYGKYGMSEELTLLNKSTISYLEDIVKNKKTFTFVSVMDKLSNSGSLYFCMGQYFASGSYDVAKVMVTSLGYKNSTSKDLKELYDVGMNLIPELIDADPLFKAYCSYMVQYDTSVSSSIKSQLKELLK